MKVGIVMTVKDRIELTTQSLEDLYQSFNYFPKGYEYFLVIVDDGSMFDMTKLVSSNYKNSFIIRHDRSLGVKKSLLEGIEYCFNACCDIVTNLDNDVRLKKDWLSKLLTQYKFYPDCIHSGFHSTNKNLDGSERHDIVSHSPNNCVFKKSVGGINMMFNKTVYEKYIKPSLETTEGNWDHIACLNSYRDGHSICVAVPSLIQHTGIHESSLGHNSELPDVAADWYDLELPDVTLFGLDDRRNGGLERAFEISQRSIKFGDALLLKHPVDGKAGYSEFMINHLYNYIHTSHVLVIQHDGYVINPAAWKDYWLEFDYIGATWTYKDNKNVGNGGFSLRSASLCKILAKMNLTNFHPEDHVICRELREVLEFEHGMIFAPEEAANEFSIEAYGAAMEYSNKYNGQFGFHGKYVDFSGWNGHKPYVKQAPPKHKQVKISDIWEGMR